MKTKTKDIIEYIVLILIVSFFILSFHQASQIVYDIYDNLEHNFETGVALGVTLTMVAVSSCLLLIVIVNLTYTIFKKEDKHEKQKD